MQEHSEKIEDDVCAFVRAKVFANAAMATEVNMAREAEHWIEAEGGVLPPGNGTDAVRWGAPAAAAAAETASAAESSDSVVSPFSKATVRLCPAVDGIPVPSLRCTCGAPLAAKGEGKFKLPNSASSFQSV